MNVRVLRVLLNIAAKYQPTEGDLKVESGEELLRDGLVEWSAASGYALSERGRVYINALVSVPLPVQAWIMPGKE